MMFPPSQATSVACLPSASSRIHFSTSAGWVMSRWRKRRSSSSRAWAKAIIAARSSAARGRMTTSRPSKVRCTGNLYRVSYGDFMGALFRKDVGVRAGSRVRAARSARLKTTIRVSGGCRGCQATRHYSALIILIAQCHSAGSLAGAVTRTRTKPSPVEIAGLRAARFDSTPVAFHPLPPVAIRNS